MDEKEKKKLEKIAVIWLCVAISIAFIGLAVLGIALHKGNDLIDGNDNVYLFNKRIHTNNEGFTVYVFVVAVDFEFLADDMEVTREIVVSADTYNSYSVGQPIDMYCMNIKGNTE